MGKPFCTGLLLFSACQWPVSAIGPVAHKASESAALFSNTRLTEATLSDQEAADSELEKSSRGYALMRQRSMDVDGFSRQVLLRADTPLERLRQRPQAFVAITDNTQRLKELVKEDAVLAEQLAFERGVRDVTTTLSWSALVGAIFFPVCYAMSSLKARARGPEKGSQVERESEAPGVSFGKWARAHPFTCMSVAEGVIFLLLMIGVTVLGYKAWEDFCAVTNTLGEVSSSLGFDFYEQLSRGWAVSKILATMGVSGEKFTPIVDNTSPHDLRVDFFTAVIRLESGSAVQLVGEPITVPAKSALNMNITGKVLPQDANVGSLPTASSSILATNGVHLGKEVAEIVLFADIKGKLGREDFTISGQVSVPCLSKYLKRNGEPGFDAAVSSKVTDCMINGLLQYRNERRSMIDVSTAVTSSRSYNASWAIAYVCAVLLFASVGKCFVAATTSILDRSHGRGAATQPLKDGPSAESSQS